MARRKAEAESSDGLPAWMATYSDLVTLLLTFFVLLYSLSAVDTVKFEAITSSLRNSFNVINGSGLFGKAPGDTIVSVTNKINASDDAEIPVPEPGSKEYTEMLQGTVIELREQVDTLNKELEQYTGGEVGADSDASADPDMNAAALNGGVDPGAGAADGESPDKTLYELTEEEKMQLDIIEARQQKLNNFKQDILEEVDKLGIGGYVSIVSEEERLVLRLNSQILFDSGSATLRPEGRAVMLALGDSFKDLDHFVDVQGHTDTVPIHTGQFPSNWELSTQRATNVVRILQDSCEMPPTRLRSTGFGEYQPIGDNSTAEGRQNNRRIDIVITTQ